MITEGPSWLSVSQVKTLDDCPRAWWNSYVLKQRTPPTVPMVKGTGLDAAANAWWGDGQARRQGDERSFIDAAIEGLRQETAKHNLGVKARDIVDITVAATAYWRGVVNSTHGQALIPAWTQRKITLNVPGVRRPVIGYIDLVAEFADGLGITWPGKGVIDTKYTSNATMLLERYWFQLCTYALATDARWAGIAFATPNGDAGIDLKEVRSCDYATTAEHFVQAEATIDALIADNTVPACTCGYCLKPATPTLRA